MADLAISRRQGAFLKIEEPYSLFVGGVGSGKTAGGARWAVREALARSATIPGLIATNTYSQLHTVTLPAFLTVLEQLGKLYVFNRRPPAAWGSSHFEKHDSILSIRLGGQRMTQVHCRSLQNEIPLRGLEFGWAWLDETRDTKKDTWDIVLARMRGFGEKQGYAGHVNRIAVTTTPAGFNWLWSTWISRDRYPDSAWIGATSYDNPWLDASYADNLRAKYPKRLAEQEIFGKFVNIATGQAYAEFDRVATVRDDLCKYDPRRDLIHAWDFNVAPLCSNVLQTDGRNVYVIDEIHVERSARTLDACDEFTRLYPKHGPTPDHRKVGVVVYGDASGGHRSGTAAVTTDFELIRQAYTAKYGPSVQMRPNHYNPEQVDRVNAVNGLLCSAAGKRRMFVHSKCEHLIVDFEQVGYKPGTRQLDKADPNLTHHSDAVGYYINAAFPIDRPPLSGYLSPA